MNAAVVRAFDAPPVYTTFDDPTPQPGERLVQVRAAGLHQIVRGIAAGSHYSSVGKLPFIAGIDGAGVLEDGMRVYFGGARFPYGTMCEQTVIAEQVIVPLPEGLEDAFAAGIANPGMSSWVALDRGRFIAGESVLILGATGSAGKLAIQIAKARGAKRVVAAGRNPDELAKLKALGADAIISLMQEPDALVAAFRAEFANGVDVVLDYLWGPPAESVLSAVAQKGAIKSGARLRYVQIGNLAGANISLPASTLRSTNIEILGSGFGSASLPDILKGVAAFFSLCATQKIEFAYKTAPLSEVESLWNAKGSGERLVFVP
jgi:NADPH:quinone reductase-like Zn-dependent oxidoreductase